MYHETYEQARAAAMEAVCRLRMAHGIERWSSPLTPGAAFRVFMLPSPAHRTGHELRCEAVEA